jgi:hypothetical protein
VDDSLQGIELCKATPEDAWTVEDGCEELQVQWELSPAARASRREILALPKAPLKAGAWYVVVAKTKTGPARLADFAVADRSDEKPPRIANVVEHDFDDRVAGMGGPGRKRAQLRVASVFDDTTEDAALRFEVFDETGKAQGKLSTALLATRPGSGQATFLDLTEHDDCRPGNFRFPKDPSKRAYSVRAVDLAGNASAKVTVEIRGQGQPDELTQPKPEPLPPLYYVPKLGVFSKPTVYRATGALLSFVLLLGLWLAWRRGQ